MPLVIVFFIGFGVGYLAAVDKEGAVAAARQMANLKLLNDAPPLELPPER